MSGRTIARICALLLLLGALLALQLLYRQMAQLQEVRAPRPRRHEPRVLISTPDFGVPRPKERVPPGPQTRPSPSGGKTPNAGGEGGTGPSGPDAGAGGAPSGAESSGDGPSY